MVSLLTDTLSDKIKKLGITCIPAAAMSPNYDFVTDCVSGLIVQKILLLVLSVRNLYRVKLSLYLKQFPV